VKPRPTPRPANPATAAHAGQRATFGAFAEIEPVVEGLIHISELSADRITHPKQVVREGDGLHLHRRMCV
jgi:ribosomal protein S1